VTLRLTAGRDPVTVWAQFEGRPGLAAPTGATMSAKPGQDATRPLTFRLPATTLPGRHVIPVWAAPSEERSREQLTDTFLVVDVPGI
jgi:hypothetical protein